MNTLYVTDRDAWRAWLGKHHQTEKEVWLIYYKKHTGKPRISYDEAVEEALCFGWIDSIVKRIDDEKFAQKFTPRKDGSAWSESNLQRAAKLISDGRMTKSSLEVFRNRNRERPVAVRIRDEGMKLPSDFQRALERNKKAWRNFGNFAPGYRKNYIAWVVSAKREETRQKRIKEAVELIAQNVKSLMK